ncbi:MAG: DNA-binding domain-containing protein [Cyclobacteriaceae bacterium]
MAIKYALYPNHLTSDPDDFMAVVQDQESRTKEDLIDVMIGRGSTVTKAEALSVLEEFEAAVQQALEEGNSINTPLFRISASIQGVFLGESESFKDNQHYVRLNVKPGSRIGEIAGNIDVQKVEASAPQPNLVSFRDVVSDTTNETLTPGGVGELTGSRLKIGADDPTQGIFLVAADGTSTQVATIIRNKPSNLIFMIPVGLPSGEYRMEVRVVFRGTTSLRVGQLNHTIQVV